MSDTHEQTARDRSRAELRTRLAERLGYLAARRWLRDNVSPSPRTDRPGEPGYDGEDDGDDAQRILSYNARIADDADEHRK